MSQLLLMLIIPPFVGVVTYAIFRIIWAKDKRDNSQLISHDRNDLQ
jgi:hypothetical protein